MKLPLFAVLLILFTGAFAQPQVWKPGSIVVDGDTIKGSVLFLDWKMSPSQISFRTPDGTERIYQAGAISGFRIDEPLEIYRAHQAELNYYSAIPVAPGVNPIIKTEPVNAFFEILLTSGDVTLYRFYDSEVSKRFFLEKSGNFRELHNYEYWVGQPSAINHIERPAFRQELKLVFNCPALDTDKARYKEDDLLRIVKAYLTTCGKPASGPTIAPVTFEQKALKAPINFGIFSIYSGLGDASVGVTMSIVSPKNFERFSTVFEVGRIIDYHPANPKSKDNYYQPFHYGIHGSFLLMKSRWSPVINIGYSSFYLLNAGVGLGNKNGMSLTVHRAFSKILDYPVNAVQLRLMVRHKRR